MSLWTSNMTRWNRGYVVHIEPRAGSEIVKQGIEGTSDLERHRLEFVERWHTVSLTLLVSPRVFVFFALLYCWIWRFLSCTHIENKVGKKNRFELGVGNVVASVYKPAFESYSKSCFISDITDSVSMHVAVLTCPAGCARDCSVVRKTGLNWTASNPSWIDSYGKQYHILHLQTRLVLGIQNVRVPSQKC